MIRFSMEDRRIRFEVNQQAAEATHLKVSARLLLLATKVIAGY
jgi:YfiR/HmsC-like